VVCLPAGNNVTLWPNGQLIRISWSGLRGFFSPEDSILAGGCVPVQLEMEKAFHR